MVRELAAEEARVMDERADTLEAAMLSAVVLTFASVTTSHAPLGMITERFNSVAQQELGKPVTNRWAGNFIRKRLRLTTHKTGGVYVVPATERQRAVNLAGRFGVDNVPLVPNVPGDNRAM